MQIFQNSRAQKNRPGAQIWARGPWSGQPCCTVLCARENYIRVQYESNYTSIQPATSVYEENNSGILRINRGLLL